MKRGALGALLAAFFGSVNAHGQSSDLFSRVQLAHSVIETIGARAPEILWPNFRPDTIAMLYVSEEGTLLANWPEGAPPGFSRTADPRFFWCAAATECARISYVQFPQFEGRAATTVGADQESPRIAAEAMHEAFHTFERISIRDGVLFGRAENAIYAPRYPAFDVLNEARFAIEAKLLQKAAYARSDAELRQSLLRWIGYRSARRARLPEDARKFEYMAELNEGLAQYVAAETWTWMGRNLTGDLQSGGAILSYRDAARLDSVMSMTSNSIRRRFYTTGRVIGLVLDRIAPDWKTRIANSDSTLESLVARSVGHFPAEVGRHVSAGEGSVDTAQYYDAAARAVASLRVERRAVFESAAGRPGVKMRLVFDRITPGRVPLCGFDPNRALPVDEQRVVLHQHRSSFCAGEEFAATLPQSAIVNYASSSVDFAVVDPVITVAGNATPHRNLGGRVERLSIVASDLTLNVARATARRSGNTVVITVLP